MRALTYNRMLMWTVLQVAQHDFQNYPNKEWFKLETPMNASSGKRMLTGSKIFAQAQNVSSQIAYQVPGGKKKKLAIILDGVSKASEHGDRELYVPPAAVP